MCKISLRSSSLDLPKRRRSLLRNRASLPELPQASFSADLCLSRFGNSGGWSPSGTVGSEEARLRAGLRPPPKLHVRFSRMQLSRRLSDARMQEKELNRSAEQARTRRRAASLAAVSSPHYASAGTDATKCVAGSSRRDVGRACGCGRVCNTRPNPAEVD